MFIALLGLGLASAWKGEGSLELNAADNMEFAAQALESTQEENAEANWWWIVNIVLTVVSWFTRRGEHFDEHQFLDIAEKQLGRSFKTRLFTRTQVDGGVWIRGQADELMLSAYNHPTKAHSVAIRSGATAKILPEKVEVAPAGCWAVAVGNPGSSHGNEALYKIVE